MMAQVRCRRIAADRMLIGGISVLVVIPGMLQTSLGVPTEDAGRQEDGIRHSGSWHHDVSQRGRDGRGEHGQRSISVIRPAQTGQRSTRWPVRIAMRSR